MENTNQTKLAYEIAHALNDMKSINFHLTLTKKYSEEFLRVQLDTALKKPDHEISKSRAAYYNYLVRLHGK